jgi:hypothetical protein
VLLDELAHFLYYIVVFIRFFWWKVLYHDVCLAATLALKLIWINFFVCFSTPQAVSFAVDIQYILTLFFLRTSAATSPKPSSSTVSKIQLLGNPPQQPTSSKRCCVCCADTRAKAGCCWYSIIGLKLHLVFVYMLLHCVTICVWAFLFCMYVPLFASVCVCLRGQLEHFDTIIMRYIIMLWNIQSLQVTVFTAHETPHQQGDNVCILQLDLVFTAVFVVELGVNMASNLWTRFVNNAWFSPYCDHPSYCFGFRAVFSPLT